MKTLTQNKKNIIWNACAGIVNAAEAVVMCIIASRVVGLNAVGFLTIAFSVGNLMASIGKYGVYNFQVTDVTNRFSFYEYLCSKRISVLLMIFFTTIYLIYSLICLDYSKEKLFTVVLICIIYAIESMEETYNAQYQKNGRLDVAAKIFIIRWCVILVSFTVLLILDVSMLFALSIATFFSFLVLQINKFFVFRRYNSIAEKKVDEFILKNSVVILKEAFPLCITTFLSFYVINSPKYAIDAQLNDEVQACFGFVFMPVFAVGLLNSFIYHPTLVDMANDLKNGLVISFKNRIKKQIIVILFITIICIAGAYVLGVPVLSWLYDTNLKGYKAELVLLQIAGGLLGISGYLSVVLTTIRQQKDLILGYVIVSIISVLTINGVVEMYGTIGATYEFILLLLLLDIAYTVCVLRRLKCINGEKYG